MLRSRRPVILVQSWHKYSAISAQSDVHLSDSRMPYEMSCGAEKHKDLMITVPFLLHFCAEIYGAFGGL